MFLMAVSKHQNFKLQALNDIMPCCQKTSKSVKKIHNYSQLLSN